MEIVKKSKKLKKRRHRNSDKNDESVNETKCEDNAEVNQNLEVKINVHPSAAARRNEVVQTDISTIFESKELLTEKDEQIKTLNERLQQITNKLYESKNAYTFLKQDFNKAQKLLCSEVGENVTVATLSSQPGGWRGRAEQIHQLQQKVSELQLKLSENDATRKKSLERRSLSSIRIFDKERKQQIENLTKELKETEAMVESTKKKLEAARARTAVLENDLNTSKRTIALLNEKTTHDNQLIELLHEQLKTAETKFQNREVDIKKQNEKIEREIVLLKGELEASHIYIQNFKRQIDEKEKELQTLRSRYESHKDQSGLQPLRVGGFRENPLHSPRSYTRDANEYIAIAVAAEAERERLMELVAVLNRRLDKERNDFEQLSDSFRKERSRATKLETKLQKIELERAGLSKVNTGYYRQRACKPIPTTNYTAEDIEELRLTYELLQEECLTLKTRLETMQKDKASDLAAFKNMLEQTRKIFKDAYRGKMSTAGLHSTVTI
ncbi:hypothetical protein TSAR_000545 [Trichomalopsis sarcophagae]|uniref:Coiled-coil domain-containing protein 13 n=1 Tax=Trichomalopsis sarcophagae TaxID=543379 RepID=A0A232ESB8_9HYME|nr:hypothetical protein TSAR_000545 [Trichomalopsis sarcophagae]